MTTITGDMAVMLDVLGLHQGDNRILDVVVLAGPAMDVDECDFDGEKSTHFVFKPTGTEIVFENDIVEMVMVRTRPDQQDASFRVYPRLAALVDGLDPATATRAEVIEFLGKPVRVDAGFEQYAVNGRYLHVEYDAEDRITKLSALLEAI